MTMVFDVDERNEDWILFALLDGPRSEEFLAEQLGIAPDTVQSSLEQLANDGLVVHHADRWRRARRAERRRYERGLRALAAALHDDTQDTPTKEASTEDTPASDAADGETAATLEVSESVSVPDVDLVEQYSAAPLDETMTVVPAPRGPDQPPTDPDVVSPAEVEASSDELVDEIEDLFS